ncbi:HET-domain-containing protein [Coniochaeta ligniaria NRRL 30616]|uniref:HET-domain-containing protein n=1 Tax=Coniochaeta ligniaria NRRL 30616 TaxID=1408157 RepID=A0A1J7IF70_9PEZI|nr:HET-domain-containing protein [Coniochaeta ligniaria NRRL 30616]
MRLLEYSNGKVTLKGPQPDNAPHYAILSHTWGPDNEEVTYRDLVDGTGEAKAGYEKIRFCAEQAKRDGLRYFWVDTCCIDKSNNTELSTAINSMFRWYQDAAHCYVYLADVSVPNSTTQSTNSQDSPPRALWEPAFRSSRWFTRGWTLQELLAPASVKFFSKEGKRLGEKRSLEQQIHEVTGVAVEALRGGLLSEFDIDERFRWSETRQTKHEEDMAYCLLGIFGVFMPLIYGEGKEHAIRRLKKEVADARNRDDAAHKSLEAKDPIWMVPFQRNASFTSRESELDRLRQALFTGHGTPKIAITGLGGVGKTQIALELACRIRAEQTRCSVMWIPSTSRESIEQAYRHAARELSIPGCDDDDKADVVKLVQDHLTGERAGQWLLVFDNADDVSIWVDRPAPGFDRLIDCLPKSSRGSIVFTTRDKKAAVKLAGRNVVELSEMDETAGKQLLHNHLIDADLCDQEDASSLLARLTYLPLAIVQAAAYINENGLSLREYLSLLEEQEEDVIDLLSEDFEDEGRYHDMQNPVATTWLISFEQIRQRDRLAADYLSFMACVDAKDIPQSLLPPVSSRKKVTDAMGTLKAYSFITKGGADSAVNIHRLVHMATRNWLRKEELLLTWTDKAITRLLDVLTDANEHNQEWRPYMPHAHYTLNSSLAHEDRNDRVYLLSHYGRCLDYDGRYREGEAQFEQLLKIEKRVLGEEHPNTLGSMHNLAITYYGQGRLGEAESLGVQVLETRKRVLGEEHPDILGSMNLLAITYHAQGRLGEAESLQVQELETRKRVLGEEHPDTLLSISSLVTTYYGQGRLGEAESLGVQVLETRKRVLGEEHPDTLVSINNLAEIYRSQGRLGEAESLGVQVLETRKRVLGEEHPYTLCNKGNLARTWRYQGRHGEASALMESCFQDQQRILGPEHPDTLKSLGFLNEWNIENKVHEQVELD